MRLASAFLSVVLFTIVALAVVTRGDSATPKTSSASYDSRCAVAWQAVRFYRGKVAQHRDTLGVSGLPPVEENASCMRLRDRAGYWRGNAYRHGQLVKLEWADPPYPYYQIAVCETGGINGGRPLWTHHNGQYSGAYGFAHSTWSSFRYPGYPYVASQATPRQQTRVAMRLVARYGGYSSWPACHRRLGLPG
jgi:hypothetical protein